MPDYEVSAALIQAWSGVKNGKLPALAGHAFDVFIAVDKHLLQQQNQALQAQLAALTDVLRTVATRLDEQAVTSRKGFADQKALADTIGGELRVVREKVNESRGIPIKD